jgi:formyltetrahydrofolate synthetase
MGPTFGIKGGAAGGGYSQVLPPPTILVLRRVTSHRYVFRAALSSIVINQGSSDMLGCICAGGSYGGL